MIFARGNFKHRRTARIPRRLIGANATFACVVCMPVRTLVCLYVFKLCSAFRRRDESVTLLSPRFICRFVPSDVPSGIKRDFAPCHTWTRIIRRATTRSSSFQTRPERWTKVKALSGTKPAVGPSQRRTSICRAKIHRARVCAVILSCRCPIAFTGIRIASRDGFARRIRNANGPRREVAQLPGARKIFTPSLGPSLPPHPRQR